MIIPYYEDEEEIFLAYIEKINNRGFLTFKESLYILFFTFDILSFYGKIDLDNISKEKKNIINHIDNEYYKAPLSIEHEVVLRRLVRQYPWNGIPASYIDLLHEDHRKTLGKVLL